MKNMARVLLALMLLASMVVMPVQRQANAETIKQYSSAFSDGRVAFKNSKNKYGYLDATGEIAIKAQFLTASPFCNGRAVVQISKGGYALDQFIDTTGKVVVKPLSTSSRYYSFNDWQGDYAIVGVWRKNKDKSIDCIGYNYVMENGKLLDKNEYTYAGRFSEGYAVVGTGYVSSNKHYMRCSDSDGNWLNGVSSTYYFIDMKGNQLGQMTWASAEPFRNGYAAVAVKNGSGEPLWGFIDQNGQLAVTPEWTSVSNFENGYARVKDGTNYGFINTSGELVIPCEYQYAGNFGANGLAVVKKDDCYNLIDAENVFQLPEGRYSNIMGSGPVYVASDGFCTGVIDQTGREMLPMAFEGVSIGPDGSWYAAKTYDAMLIANEKGRAVTVMLVDGSIPTQAQAAAYADGDACSLMSIEMPESGRMLYLFQDESGKTISMNMFTKPEGESFHLVKGSGKTQLFSREGQRIGTEEWDDANAAYSTPSLICVMKNDVYGFVNMEGKTVVRPSYTSVTPFSNGITMAMMGSNPFFLDDCGRAVLPYITKKSAKDDIAGLQQALTDGGYYTGKVDGKYSNKLTEAIKAAQTALGMEATGVADSALQYALTEQ